jgi:hypothetical protein
MATGFAQTESVTGAAAQNLYYDVMSPAGFTGRDASLKGQQLTLGAPAAQALYWGYQSDVSDAGATKGAFIAAGDYYTFPSATGRHGDVIDPATIYLYLATTADVIISYSAL